MANIRSYIRNHLLDPLKQYPTVIQDTMIEIITDRLEELYELTWRFPEILTPSQSRLDILQVIADQFVFTVREDADIEEQVNILNNILYIYNKRGSIDTIENMWKYYGGTLPQEVEVVIPSYNLFRYNISKWSDTHAFIKGNIRFVTLDRPAPYLIDAGSIAHVVGTTRVIVTTNNIPKDSSMIPLANTEGLEIGEVLRIGEYEGTITSIYDDPRAVHTVNRPGIFEIKLINNTYPIPDLKEFLLKELVAAGNEIFFTNVLHMHITGEDVDTNPYEYLIHEDDFFEIQMPVMRSSQGFTWSGINALSSTSGNSKWSGNANLWLELFTMYEIGPLPLDTYKIYRDLLSVTLMPDPTQIKYDEILVHEDTQILIDLYCTSSFFTHEISRHLYIRQGEGQDDLLVESKYPGYFIVGETLLNSTIY